METAMDVTTMTIDRDGLERVLDLQRRAYSALLWLNECGKRDASLLSDESLDLLKSEKGALEWLGKMAERLPADVRPSETDGTAFVHLLSAFLQTSFRLEKPDPWGESGPARRRLVPGQAVSEGAHRSKRKRLARQRATARDLEALALGDLARENGLRLRDRQLRETAACEGLAEDLALWTYAHEIVRRSLFASQGAAVHRLWRDMDPSRRKRLTASDYWASRERILAHLRSLATT